jgi:hypothetical protein
MAALAIDADSVTVSLSSAEKVEGLHGAVTLARSSIVRVRSVADGTAEIHGLYAPGTGIPGVVAVGTWRQAGRRTFAACTAGVRPWSSSSPTTRPSTASS